MLRLVKPSYKYKKSFLKALKEFGTEDISGIFATDLAMKNFSEYLERINKDEKGIDLPKNFVPSTTYWLIDNTTYIGGVSFRHRLTPRLKKYGGHIGYSIRPSKREKGYGKQMLALTLRRVKKNGLKKVLITCDNDNIASQKIIKANGGILQNTINTKLNPNKKPTMRWWIKIT